MKRILLFTFTFLLTFGAGIAQNAPFPQNDAVWKEEHITFIGPVTKHFALCGDTLINDIQYSQVFELQVDGNGEVLGKTYMGGLRSDEDLVSFLPSYPFNEFILYDFSLIQGDQIDLYPLNSDDTVLRTVDSVKMENIAGKLRKVIYFHPSNPNFPVEYWIEGIGSSYGLLGRAFEPGGDIGFALLCFRHDGEYLNLTAAECELPELTGCEISNGSKEENSPFLTLGPNPASETFSIVWENSEPAFPWQVKVFDAKGSLALTAKPETSFQSTIPAGNLTPGLYFVAVINKETGEALWREKVVVQR